MSQAHSIQTEIQPGYTDRERYAIEATRANALERENDDLKAQLDTMRARDLRNLDELTECYTALRIKFDDVTTACADWENIATLRAATLACVDDKLKRAEAENRAYYSALKDAINGVEDRDCAIGVLKSHPVVACECSECSGRGSFGGPGSLSDDDPRREMPKVECAECNGLGWVTR